MQLGFNQDLFLFYSFERGRGEREGEGGEGGFKMSAGIAGIFFLFEDLYQTLNFLL